MSGQRAGRILFVDDDENIRELASEIFKEQIVVTAPDVATAFALLTRHAFDVVITDFSLPGGTGQRLIEAIHQHHVDTSTILMSAYEDVEALAEACGADNWFMKGASPITVLQTMVLRLLDC